MVEADDTRRRKRQPADYPLAVIAGAVLTALAILATPGAARAQGRGFRYEAPAAPSGGGFLAGLNELLAPKEVILDLTRLSWDDLTGNALVLGGSAAFAAFAVDEVDDVAVRLGPERLDDFTDSMAFLGRGTFLYPALVSTFIFAKKTDRPGLSRTVAHMTQALMLTDLIVLPLKLATGRERPDGSNSLSFPSGHTAGAFALATVLQHNYGLKAGVPAYVFAAMMGTARIDAHKHFLSDVVAGAAIGYLAATAVSKRFRGRDVSVFAVRGRSGGRGLGFAIEF